MGEQKMVKEFEPVMCTGCKQFLFEEAIFMGKVRIVCRDCKTVTTFERTPDFAEDEAQLTIKRPKKKRQNGR